MQVGDERAQAQFGDNGHADGHQAGSQRPDGQAEEQAALYRLLVQHSPNIITLMAADGTIRYISPAVTRALGYAPAEVMGHQFFEFVHPDDTSQAMADLQWLVQHEPDPAAERDKGIVLRLRAQDGSWHWFENTVTNLLHDPAVGALVVNAHEVVGHQETLQRMHFQANVLQQVHDAVVAIDLEEKIIYWNEAAEELLQVPREAALGRHRDEVYAVRWIDEAAATEARARAWHTGGGWQGDKIMRVVATGCEFYVESTVTSLRNEENQPIGWISTMRDASQRKAAEAALRQSEARFRTSVEALMDGFAITRAIRDTQGQIIDFHCLYINDAGCRLTQIPREEHLAHTALEMFPDQIESGLFQHFVEVVETGQPVLLESFAYRYKVARESTLLRYLDIQIVKFEDGYAIAWRDVTERQQTVDNLREREERFHKIFDEGPLGMAIVDLHSRVIQPNGQLMKMLGYTAQEFAGLSVEAITHPDDWRREEALVNQIFNGELASFTLEKRYLHKDGRVVWGNLTASLIHDSAGQPRYGIGMVQDISERKASEAMMRQILEGAQCLLWTADLYYREGRQCWRLSVLDEEAAARFLPVECAPGEDWPSAWARSRPPEDTARCDERAHRAIQEGWPGYKQEYRCCLADGTTRWMAEDVRVVVTTPGQWQLVGVCTDVTERKHAQQQQAAFAAGLQAVIAAADELLTAPDLETLERRGVELARERLGLERCGLFLSTASGDIEGTYGTDAQGHTCDEHHLRFTAARFWADIFLFKPRTATVLDTLDALSHDATSMAATGDAALSAASNEQAAAVNHNGTAPRALWYYGAKTAPTVNKDGATMGVGKGAAAKGWVVATPIHSPSAPIGVLFNDTAITGAPVDEIQQELLAVYGSLLSNLIERKRIEEQMRESEERYRQLVELAPDAVFVHDTEKILFANSAAAELVRAPDAASLEGVSVFALIRPERHAASRESLPRMLSGGTLRHIESKLTRLDGTLVEIEYAGTPITYQGQQAMLSVVHDITERQQMLQSLRESEQRFAEVFHASPIGISITSADGTILDVNASMEHLFGRSRETMVGHSTYEVNAWVDMAQRAQMMQALHRDGMLHDYELAIRRPDGQIRYILASLILIDLNGQQCILSLARDVTEHRQMTLQLQEYATKLERSNRELQEFAYVASHDLQEPLRKIQAFGDRLKTKHSGQLDEAGQDYLMRMQSAAARMNGLIKDLLCLSRISTQARPFVRVSLPDVMQGVLSDLELRIEQTGAQVEVGPLPELQADPAQMHQLLLNLVTNALKFQRPGAAPVIRVHSQRLEGGGSCRLTVQDNGIGFDPKHAERVFLPFQRLHGRSEYEGTGMGLAICRRIAERHGGTITATSEPDVGTTFTVILPLRHEPHDGVG
ncbi:MAG: PAS domain S-box protein [Abitibacteriaceae bacterium]|nr:PAS domain S-box protein [Abditibacteriaceae bacterium]